MRPSIYTQFHKSFFFFSVSRSFLTMRSGRHRLATFPLLYEGNIFRTVQLRVFLHPRPQMKQNPSWPFTDASCDLS
ncbi:hypothetical protein XELAEV_18003891mg [Xenopus laevis]|uniref:Uncharacterized protein n=1 Tax=Xenopus laevis TaxID=8355 RepID=A0A974GY35_XENLA|nr:hypothetical protein XELAEV_18003891mg [Xenopus laevis]